MDLSEIVASTNVVEIKHPATAEPIGLKITLRATSSKEVREVQRRMLNENLKNRGRTLTAEKVEANRLDVLVAATQAWDWAGELTFKGAKPEFNAENVRKVYKDLSWVKDQVDDALSDDAAFFRGVDGSTN
jgi:hypothetical protein